MGYLQAASVIKVNKVDKNQGKPSVQSRSDCVFLILSRSPTSPENESKLQPPSAYYQFT
jgi:hypothetical protein